jgi:hypothetical protein
VKGEGRPDKGGENHDRTSSLQLDIIFDRLLGLSAAHGESVRILNVETVWSHTVYQVWIPRLATIERVPAESLSPVQPTKSTGLDRITYAVAAARIADALTRDVLLAPLEAGVIPLPHQLHALTRAVTGDRVRYLLADEVGLGKTIEAGLVFQELNLRGLVKRVLASPPRASPYLLEYPLRSRLPLFVTFVPFCSRVFCTVPGVRPSSKFPRKWDRVRSVLDATQTALLWRVDRRAIAPPPGLERTVNAPRTLWGRAQNDQPGIPSTSSQRACRCSSWYRRASLRSVPRAFS